jgi:hypothetical protein
VGELDAVSRWVDKVEKGTVEARKAMVKAAGVAGKKAALDSASRDLGGDRRFRNMPRGRALDAGYDLNGTDSVTINFRGPWRLAEGGRKKSGPIYRRGVTSTTGKSRKGNVRAFRTIGSFAGGQAHRAVRTPQGPRAHSSYGRSKGLKTYTDAVDKARTAVPKAAHDEFVKAIGRAL